MLKPNLDAVVQAFADQVQDLEDAAYSLIMGRAIQYATGATLERIGDELNLPRPITGLAATDDGAYRALLFGQIVVHTSHGEPESVLQLLRLLGATAVVLREVYPAAIDLDYTGDLLTTDPDTIRLLEQATAPVRLMVSQRPAGSPFGFDGDPEALGFGQGEFQRGIA